MTTDEPTPVETGYDRWAATYDAGVNLTRDAASAKVQAWAALFRGKDVLEIGCGTGRNTAMLAQAARRVDAVDFSSEMLAQARRRPDCAGVRFLRHDITAALPFASEQFEVTLESLVLEHVADLSPVFAEVFRVLRPGGEFVGSELHPYRQRIGRQARFQIAGEQQETRITAYRHDISEFVNQAIVAGFDIVRLDEDQDISGELRLLSFRLRKR